MKIEFQSEPSIKLHGYSPEDLSEILARVTAGVKPSSLKGDFILVAEGLDAATNKPLTVFVSTVVAAIPYYFYLAESRLIHSTNVFDCCQAAGLLWEWNWEALGQIALFDHVFGDLSLHKSISRIPQASVVKVCNGELEVFKEPFWTELFNGEKHNVKCTDATSILLDILSELPTENGYSLSLSAGYDSRLLLACMAHLNRSVTTACMGAPDSTDPRIAQQLAHHEGYDFKLVEIEPVDYVTWANDIVKTTSGEKTFQHWHSGIYSKKVGFASSSIHLAGANGEFARSFFFDKGFIAKLLDTLKFSRWDYWLALRNSSLRQTAPEIRLAIEPDSSFGQMFDARSQMNKVFIKGLRFGDGLDRFYTSERVRNFIGLGLALYRSEFTTMSPFLDARFICYAANLKRHDKLANRMHKSVIEQLKPKLLDFPTDESGFPMSSAVKPLYFMEKKSVKKYQRHQDAQTLPQVKSWARQGFAELIETNKFEPDLKLQTEAEKWNLAISIGVVLEVLQKLGIKKA